MVEVYWSCVPAVVDVAAACLAADKFKKCAKMMLPTTFTLDFYVKVSECFTLDSALQWTRRSRKKRD